MKTKMQSKNVKICIRCRRILKIDRFKYQDKGKYTKKCKECLRVSRHKKPDRAEFVWLNNTLKRDNFTCVDCGFSDQLKLIVHHIDESRKTGTLNNDPENLVTLCRHCHAVRHSQVNYREDIKELRDGGLTFGEIGKRLGLTRQRVHQLYQKLV